MENPYSIDYKIDYKIDDNIEDNLDYYFQQKLIVDKPNDIKSNNVSKDIKPNNMSKDIKPNNMSKDIKPNNVLKDIKSTACKNNNNELLQSFRILQIVK